MNVFLRMRIELYIYILLRYGISVGYRRPPMGVRFIGHHGISITANDTQSGYFALTAP